MKFVTKLWKRSKKSFATTIPHIALLGLDEEKEHECIWEFNSELNKWTLELKPKQTDTATASVTKKKGKKSASKDETLPPASEKDLKKLAEAILKKLGEDKK